MKREDRSVALVLQVGCNACNACGVCPLALVLQVDPPAFTASGCIPVRATPSLKARRRSSPSPLVCCPSPTPLLCCPVQRHNEIDACYKGHIHGIRFMPYARFLQILNKIDEALKPLVFGADDAAKVRTALERQLVPLQMLHTHLRYLCYLRYLRHTPCEGAHRARAAAHRHVRCDRAGVNVEGHEAGGTRSCRMWTYVTYETHAGSFHTYGTVRYPYS